MTREIFLEELAARIVAVTRQHPTRVAIDGVDAAGKTTLANALVAPVARSGRQVIRASVDGFHRPRALRYARGRDSPEGFFRDSFDTPKLLHSLLAPLGPGGDRGYRVAAFDHPSDSPVDSPGLRADENAVLLLDGIFLQRPELRDQFDLTIFLDVSFEASRSRAALRDGCDPDPAAPENRRYVEGQRLYLRECRPRESADLLVDYDDPERPVLRRG